MYFRSFLFIALLSFTAHGRGLIDPSIMDILDDDTDKFSTVIVALKTPFDLSKIPKSFKSQEERGKKIAALLKAATEKAIAKDFPFLKLGPDVKEITPLWISNAVVVTAKPDIIKQLTEREFESIHKDERKEVSEMQDTGLATSVRADKLGWGVEKLRAPELWKGDLDNKKIDGTGALVAMIDSGINIEHPDLKPNIYKNPGEIAGNGKDDDKNGFIDDVNGWNFETNTNDPKDAHGHGTQTAGIVGGMGANGTQTGVAPHARLIPIRACCDLNAQAGEAAILEGMQYAVQMGAKVISMSLTVKHFSKPSYALWRRASETTLAAQVIHINSAGNLGKGKEPHNIGAPATNPPAWFHNLQTPGNTAAHTSMITIGATDKDDKLRSYSSVGPVTWEDISQYADFPYAAGKKPGLIKPEVCGPSEVPSTSIDGKTYTLSFGGTSSATPHIGGVAALLVSAYKNLTPAQATEALQMTAIPVEGNKYSNQCGAGRVDAVEAVKYVLDHFARTE